MLYAHLLAALFTFYLIFVMSNSGLGQIAHYAIESFDATVPKVQKDFSHSFPVVPEVPRIVPLKFHCGHVYAHRSTLAALFISRDHKDV